MMGTNIPEDVKAAVEKWRSEVVQRGPSWMTYMAAKSVGLQAAYEAFQLGVAHEREECARVADRKMEEATAAEPCVEPASEAIRAGHFAIAAGQVADAIRARGDEK